MSLDKPTHQEDDYFAKEDIRLRLALKDDLVHTKEEIAAYTAIAKAAGAEDIAIGESLCRLGFDAETVAIIPLIPMLEVAWSDEKMTFNEGRLILDTARARGLSATSKAYAKLKSLVDERPEDAFFEGVNRNLAELLREHHGVEAAQEKRDLLSLMNAVAEISGGFFGFGDKVGDEEKASITKLVKDLGLNDVQGQG